MEKFPDAKTNNLCSANILQYSHIFYNQRKQLSTGMFNLFNKVFGWVLCSKHDLMCRPKIRNVSDLSIYL